MDAMRVCLAQLNTTVGDIEGNVRKIIATLQRASSRGVALVVFPELTITGYPPLDLLERSAFIEANLRGLHDVVRATFSSPSVLVVGYAEPNPSAGKGLFNAAAVIYNGKVLGVHRKVLLPTYDVFDEARYFEKGPGPKAIETPVGRLAVTICEDIWNDKAVLGRSLYHEDPVQVLAKMGPDIFVNLSASPFVVGKMKVRLQIAKKIVSQYRVPFVYVNLVGGNDGLIFDGESFIITRDQKVATAAAFQEDELIENPDESLTISPPQAPPSDDPISATVEALCLGIRDFCRKLGFERVTVGLSGGIDSAVVASLAVRALGPERVRLVSMPSRYTSELSKRLAREIASNLGARLDEVPIDPIVDAYLKVLEPVLGPRPWGVTEENIQARVRGAILMAISNRDGSLVLNTGNKSELAVGYCTLYGDMVGGLAVIGDLTKQRVYEVARFINREREVIPPETLSRPPSAELRPNQKDEDSLPPYPLLDPIVSAYVEDGLDAQELVRAGHDPTTVATALDMIARSEYKRRQAPVVLKVTKCAFGPGRRFPIVNRFRDVPNKSPLGPQNQETP